MGRWRITPRPSDSNQVSHRPFTTVASLANRRATLRGRSQIYLRPSGLSQHTRMRYSAGRLYCTENVSTPPHLRITSGFWTSVVALTTAGQRRVKRRLASLKKKRTSDGSVARDEVTPRWRRRLQRIHAHYPSVDS